MPTIVNWPGKLKPGKCTSPAQITDWMPTLCGLAHHKPGRDLNWDGTNIWPVLAAEAKRESHPLYWVAPGYNARAVRDGDWKLIVHGKQKPAKIELFNLSSDPNETTNLAPQMQGKVGDLQRTLAEFARVDRE